MVTAVGDLMRLRTFIRRANCAAILVATVGQLATWDVATADMVSASATPRSASLSSVGASSAPRPVSVRWSLASTNGIGTVTSTTGVFRAGVGGPVLGSVPTVIAAPISGGLASASEIIRVPSGLAQQATRLGASLLVYERSWDDTDTALPASLLLVLGGGKGGAFEAQRVELGFDDGASLRIVERGGSLRPRALLSYSGSGVVEAIWEVALAGDTEGVAIFQPLQRVRRQLGAGGRVVIDGPVLPTQRPGFHLVRLRLLEPALAFDDRRIRYLVSDTRSREVVVLTASGPPEGGGLDPDSRFRWEPEPGTDFYQLEFFASELASEPGPEAGVIGPDAVSREPASAGDFVAGIALPAGALETQVSRAARTHLRTGATYLWRVRAVASDGRTLAASPLRSLRVGPGTALSSGSPEE